MKVGVLLAVMPGPGGPMRGQGYDISIFAFRKLPNVRQREADALQWAGKNQTGPTSYVPESRFKAENGSDWQDSPLAL
jgi:hypothetical protein